MIRFCVLVGTTPVECQLGEGAARRRLISRSDFSHGFNVCCVVRKYCAKSWVCIFHSVLSDCFTAKFLISSSQSLIISPSHHLLNLTRQFGQLRGVYILKCLTCRADPRASNSIIEIAKIAESSTGNVVWLAPT